MRALKSVTWRVHGRPRRLRSGRSGFGRRRGPRSLSGLGLAALLVGGLSAITPARADTPSPGATGPTWSTLLGEGTGGLQTVPGDGVVALGELASGQVVTDPITPAGQTLPELQNTLFTDYETAAGRNGALYMVEPTADGSGQQISKYSWTPSGLVRQWSTPENVGGQKVVVGGDGNVYSILNSVSQSFLVGLSASDGHQLMSAQIPGWISADELDAYSAGIVLIDGSGNVDFFGFSGEMTTQYAI